ncbi:uncharacterized protein Tco_0530989 [Tanacetum coccineum]
MLSQALCVRRLGGRIGFARALVEVSADRELKEEVIMAMPVVNGTCHTKVSIRVEYEWKPPMCRECHVFGHSDAHFSKRPKPSSDKGTVDVTDVVQQDGFTLVTKKKKKAKAMENNPRQFKGVRINKAKTVLMWSKKAKQDDKSTNDDAIKAMANESAGTKGVVSTNQFSALENMEDPFDFNVVGESSKKLNRGQALPLRMVSMFSVAAWNIRGLNRTPKQFEVRQVVNENNLSVCGILESHVDISSLSIVCSKVFRSWDWIWNINQCVRGCRIIVGWNKDVVDVMVIAQMSQVLHLKIMHKTNQKVLFCSFVYASNSTIDRRQLWADLGLHKLVTRGMPWVLMGDFNVALDLADVHSGASRLSVPMYDFQDCVANIELDAVQTALDGNPNDLILCEEEATYLSAFNDAKLDEERYLRQKAKVEWLGAGDSNSAYFHKIIKNNNSHAQIDILFDSNNNEVIGAGVPEAFVNHYKAFLGMAPDCDLLDTEGLFMNKVSDAVASDMVRPISNEEIRCAMFDIGDDRAPGPDGFTSALFKKGWDVVGNDVCNVVRDFFTNGKLLKEVNHTFVALIPKVPTPTRVNDYRPISCCNVIYKCISKILTKRVIGGIEEELMHNYHRNRGPPRCAFKVDIQKAYKTVDWLFLKCILYYFGFYPTMIKWIMACVSSASFSICINGDVHRFIKGKRRLRQGDPLSPYLFTLIMEVLTLILKTRVSVSDTFRYHHYCDELELINVCFADDLFIFARGDTNSVRVIMEGLDEFKKTSSLVPSLPKSTVFFCNVPNYVKNEILNIMPFVEGKLPVRYLRVPLISSRLLNRDCKALVNQAKNRIRDWKNKLLSFAGIVYDIHQLIRGFLWCNGEYKRGKAKVAWDVISLPKSEGGLGIRSLEMFNIALMTKHIWSIVSKRKSLWVNWIHIYKLRGRSFWDIPIRANMSWGWRKLLQLRGTVWPYFWSKIGNERDTLVLFDNWCPYSPIAKQITPRDVANAGYSMAISVADLVADGA